MITFEHSLFKLLLLVAVLSARPPGRRWLLFFIAGGMLLALLPPAISLPVPWDLLLGLVIPLMLWQNARRIISARWEGKWKDISIWLVAAILFAVIFWSFKELTISGAILFGLVAASMIWSAGETEETASIISLIGPFTLIFLLAEVEPLIQAPTEYVGGVLSGLSFGAVIAFGSLYVAKKTDPKIRNWITLGQIYLAYGFAFIIGASAVAASLASVIVYVTVGLKMEFWPDQQVAPRPLNTRAGFFIVLILFLLLGWEAHYPPSGLLLLEIVIGFLLSLAVAWVGQGMNLEAFPQNLPLWRIGLRVTLLLFPALLIWPRQTLEQPILLASALGIAVANLILARITLDYFSE